MSTRETGDRKFLRIIDAMASINQKVNIIGVVTEIGLSKQSRGTDCCCTLTIVDETHANSGISVNFFAENFEKLPHVESAGDIIQLFHVVVKTHESRVNVVFNKKFSSFALYEGKDGSNCVPYQVSSKFKRKEQDNKFIAGMRKWTASQQPETASSDYLSLKDIKQGDQFNLICKHKGLREIYRNLQTIHKQYIVVLHICEVTRSEWMLFLWDGTDAPLANVQTNLEEELENPLPLQLETSSLSRNILCEFPTVGTVLRMITDRSHEKLGLHLLKAAGKWVQLKNINFEARSGIWCGILLPQSKFSYLLKEDNHVLQCQRAYDERMKSKWYRMPLSCFPWPSHITDTDNPDVPFVTLMDILSYPEVTAKFRCVVRVLATLPGHPSDFRAPCDTYRLRLTLEDPTARIHAFLYAEDAVKFFGGFPSVSTMIKMQNALLGIEERDTISSNEKPRNPPWVQCCLKSYYFDQNDIWGSRRYRIFATSFIGFCS